MRHVLPLLCVTFVFTIGCGGKDPEQACNDVADALARGLENCGYSSADVEEARTGFKQAVGGCTDVKDIRDEDELYDMCIPSLEDLDCESFASGAPSLHESCNDQLLRE